MAVTSDSGTRRQKRRRLRTIPAHVDMVEPIGHESIVYASAGEEKLVAIFDPHDAPRAGELVSFSVSRLHLFDAASEAALQPQ